MRRQRNGLWPEERAEQLLEQLATLRRHAPSDPFYQMPAEAAPLVKELHDIARLIIKAPASDETGRPSHNSRLCLHRMFQLGVFDSPPLSGLPYAAWKLARFGQTDSCPESAAHSAGPSGLGHEARPGGGPLFSVLLPVYNPDIGYLEAALASLRAQTWQDWECCVSDDASTRAGVHDALRRHAAEDPRIRVTFRPVNGHISASTNTALAMARGEWCVLLDHDDVLEPDALEHLARVARQHPDAAVLFSDEDQVWDAPDGTPQWDTPLFKPGLDPDLLLACNVVSHLGAYRTTALRQLEGFRAGTEGAQDHDLAFRCLARFGAAAFVHIPSVLYHWRRHEGSTSSDWQNKPYVHDAAHRSRTDFAKDTGLRVEFVYPSHRIQPRVSFQPPSPAPLLTLCLLAETPEQTANAQAARRIVETCGYPKHEVVLAMPEDAAPDRALERVLEQMKGRVARARGNGAFALAGAAAGMARGKVLAFLRLPDLPATDGWAARAVGALWRPDIAAAGCRSVDAEGFLVQAGYAAGQADEDVPLLCPAYAGLHVNAGGYFVFAHLLHSVPAVMLAGMVCRRELFERLDGFDPRAGALADADFCLRAWAGSGLRSVILPDADFVTLRRNTPLPLEGDMRERWAELWKPGAREGVPFQSPMLWWTPGGWRLRVF